MNKKFATFFSDTYALNINGNSAYGNIHGYEANAVVAVLDNVSPLRIHLSFYATDEQKRSIEAAVRNLAIKYFRMNFTPYGLFIGLNDITMGKLIKRLPDILQNICNILSENGALKSEYCPVCGNALEEANLKECNVNGFKIKIDNDCVQVINNVISAENADFANAPNNYLKGFAGAVIGGLAGVAISVLLYVVGFVSSISAVVAIVLGAFLYEKFHGKPNKMMIVIVSLTTMVMLAATIPVVYIVAAGMAAKESGLDMTAMEAFKICMEDSEFSSLFYADIALVIVFSLIGTVLEIFTIAKRIKRQQNI